MVSVASSPSQLLLDVQVSPLPTFVGWVVQVVSFQDVNLLNDEGRLKTMPTFVGHSGRPLTLLLQVHAYFG